ncbi:MAG TPA: hypothetical protein VFK36_09320 [Gemmatimonadales bacterium]|nr:hypothetical protein [Gemmatimonadales bacterium]
MPPRLALLSLALFMGAAAPLAGQATAPPPAAAEVVKSGFEAYRAHGNGAAVDAWTAGSVLATDATVKPNMLQALNQIEAVYGSYQGFDVLAVVKLGGHGERDFVAIRYELGQAFAYFDVYRAGAGSLITAFQYNTKAQEILPASWWGR